MQNVTVGKSLDCTIGFLDQSGKPMSATPDVPPSWTNSDPSVEMLAVSSNGLKAIATAVAVGSDVISVDVVVAGAHYQASLQVTVQPAPQVLTSVVINTTVV